MFKRILVPVDNSVESRTILRWAVGLGRSMGSRVTLLSVVDPEDIQFVEATMRNVTEKSDYSAPPTKIIDEVVSKVKKQLESEASGLRSTGVDIDVRVAFGAPAESIVEEAGLIDADLIAMSTRRESALARGILGSVTDRVLHSTATPLMILQPEDVDDESVGSGFIRHIIVPLDGSTLSESAVAPAIELARATRAELVFTEVIKLPVYGMDMGGVGYGSVHYAEELDTKLQEENAATYLQSFVENAESTGLKARAVVRVGNPSLQIVSEASAAEGSIIAMATHGSGGIKRWVIGSVTDKAIRSAHRPVLVIPPEAA